MTALRILHISDLHARGQREAKRAWKRDDVLGDPWRRNLDELAADGRPFDIVAFTGDVADWGLAEEYARATPFIAEVLERLRVERERLFVVPGNHDINRKLKKSAWAKLREGIFSLPRQISEWMADDRKAAPVGFRKAWRDDVLERQSAFWAWVEQDLGRGELLPQRSPHGRLGYRVSTSAGAQPVHIIGLDSAWLAGDDGDAGRLWLTDDQMGLLCRDAQGQPLAGFRLALMHHPLTDLADAVMAGRQLGDHVDLVLRGHQHTPLARSQIDPDRSYRELAAGCLYEGDAGNTFANTCQVIDVAFDEAGRALRYDIRFRAWSPRSGYWHDDSSLYREATGGRLTWEHVRTAGAGPVTPPVSVSMPASVAPVPAAGATAPPPTVPASIAPPPTAPELSPTATASRGRSMYATPVSGVIVVYRCMAQAPQGFIERRQLTELVATLEQAADSSGHGTTTLALRGSGGFGKTTLAQALCMDERVWRAYPDGVLWTTLGEHLTEAERLGRVLDVLRWWTGEEVPSFTSASAAGAELRQRLAGHRVLLVIDDVWQSADLAPFLGLGPGAAVLITTRDRRTLPQGCAQIEVDSMHEAESLRLLGAGMEVDPSALAGLAVRLGHWPLLLGLVNRQLRELVEEQGLDVAEAIAEVERLLEEEGLTAFDVEDDQARRTAVERTMAVSLQRLDEDTQQAYERLAVFPEDADVPLAVLARFWGVDLTAARKLCARLQALSLLLRFDVGARTIRLHDVFRQYLIDRQGEGLPALHREWLAVFRPASGRWPELPADEPYAWRFLAYHLRQAGRDEELAGLLFDFDWLHAKLAATGMIDLLADFEVLDPGHAASRDARLLHDAIRLSSHVIGRDLAQLPGQLLGRLGGFGQAGHGRMARLLERTRELRGPLWLRPRMASLVPPGGPLLRTLAGHESNVWAVAVTPDGTRAVSASADRTLKLWDLDHGTALCTMTGHTGWVRAVAVTPDGARAVSASNDGTLRLWDLDRGVEILILAGHEDEVLAAAITPDGTRAVSASHDKTLKLWDLDRGAEICTLTGHGASVRAVAVTPDGKRAVSASEDQTLKLWDIDRCVELRTLTGHVAGVRAVTVTPDGKRALSTSLDKTLRIWDLDRGVELRTLAGHQDVVLGVVVMPDGKRALSCSADGVLVVWDLGRGAVIRTVARHSAIVWMVAVTPDGTRALSASADATLQLWDLALGSESGPRPGHGASVQAVAVTPDGTRALSASDDHTLRLWDLERGTELLTLVGHGAGVQAVAITPDGARAVSASADRTLKLWDLRRGVELLTLAGHGAGVWAVAVTPDGRRAVSASHDRTLKLWDLQRGVELLTLTGHDASVRAVAVTPDGKRAVSASSDRLVKLWDLAHGVELLTLAEHGSGVRAVAVTADGTRVISASSDGTLKLCDLERCSELRTLTGHGSIVNAVAVTPDGKRVLSASLDQTLKLWDLDSGQLLATFTADGPIHTCAIAPTGRVLVAGDRHGRLHVLDLIEPA